MVRANQERILHAERTVRGNSMAPCLENLDKCSTIPCDPLMVRIGDILLYKTTPGEENLNIHRVISMDRKKRVVILKGDNVAGSFDTVNFSDVMEKAVAIKKNGNQINLTGAFASFAGYLTAVLSRYDLSPSLARRRMLDPIAAMLSTNLFYAFFRRVFFYKNISCASFDTAGGVTLHAYAGGRVVASAELRRNGDDVFVLADIKWRDRNGYFSSIFLAKIDEVSGRRFGDFSKLIITSDSWPGKFSRGGKTVAGAHNVIFENNTAGMEREIDLYPLLAFSREELVPEQRLSVLCSGIEVFDTGDHGIEKTIREERINWDLFLRMVLTYRIAPFVYRHLRRMKDLVPENVIGMLREGSACAFARNTIATDEIKMVSHIFAEARVEAIFLKGAALMYDIYGGPGLREFNDIDVLIKENDLDRADEALRAGGFSVVEGGGGVSDYRSQRVYSFNGKLTLDLHTGLLGRKLRDRMLSIDREALWEGKRSIEAGGTAINTLDISHTLLYQCLHFAVQHGFIGLAGGVDIREILIKHAADIDWEEVIKLAAEYRIKKPVYYSLHLVETMLDAPVPADVLKSLASAETISDKWLFGRIRSGNREVDYLAELFMFDSTRDAIKFIFLSFLVYPYLAGHFMTLFVKMLTRSK